MSGGIEPPAGFEPHFRRSPVTDAWEPLFSKRDAECFVFGLRVAEAHCNARAMLHGGVLSSLCDNAMGIACALALGEGASLVTIHLAVDFLGAVRVGQWLEISATATQPGRTIAFASAEAHADGKRIGNASALFRVVSTDGASPA